MTSPHLFSRRDLFAALRSATRTSVSSVYTPVERFYRELRNHYPVVHREHWRLTLAHGAQSLVSLSYDDLLTYPATELEATLCNHAVHHGSALIGHARWRGVALRDVLPTSGEYARVTSSDGRDTALTRQQMESALLAYTVNGEELPADMGYPVKLIVPGMYDHKCPGWITRIELSGTPAADYWSQHGKVLPEEVQPLARIDHISKPSRPDALYRLRGIAYAGLHTVESVEVSIDDGDWTPVGHVPGAPGCWSHWQGEWQPALPGSYAIRVRARVAGVQPQLNPLHSVIVHVEAAR